MEQLFQKLKDWWQEADRTTKTVTLVGAGLFLAVVYFTFSLSSQPKLVPVVSGMTDAEKGPVFDELTKKGIKVELSQQGEVVVPAKDVARAKMLLASANKLPKGGAAGMSLASIGAFDTPSVEQEKLRKSLETDLATSVQTIDGVAAATVHIAPGKSSAVMDEKVPPTAVISITESSPGSVSKTAGRSIANLIQSAVTGLEAKGVKVINNAGRMLYDGEDEAGDSGMANSKLETERQMSRESTQQLQQELDAAWGKGATIATVQVTLNMDPTQTTKHVETPSESPLYVEKAGEKLSTNAGGNVGGVAGAEANTPAAPAAVGTSNAEGKKYDNSATSQKFGLSYTNTSTVKAPEVVGKNISVLVDKKRVKNAKDLETFVKGKLGGNIDNPAFVATVVPTEFSTADAEMAKKAADEAAANQKVQTSLSILPVLALVGVGFVLAKALGRLAPVAAKSVASTPAGTPALGGFGVPAFGPGNVEHRGLAELAQYGQIGGLTMEPQIIEHRLIDERTKSATAVAEPELPKESFEEREARETQEVMRALGIDEEDETVDIEAIKARINIPLERIKRMVDRKPEMTAMLIKSWLLEDHR
jgi:flagellar M-ring protein FliF